MQTLASMQRSRRVGETSRWALWQRLELIPFWSQPKDRINVRTWKLEAAVYEVDVNNELRWPRLDLNVSTRRTWYREGKKRKMHIYSYFCLPPFFCSNLKLRLSTVARSHHKFFMSWSNLNHHKRFVSKKWDREKKIAKTPKFNRTFNSSFHKFNALNTSFCRPRSAQ